MNNLQRHKRSDAIKWFVVTIAILLLAVAVMAAMTKGFKDWNPYGWLGKECVHEYAEDGKCSLCGEEKPTDKDMDEAEKDNDDKPETNAVFQLAF